MPVLHCPAEEALLVVIDVQPTFMAAIDESERVIRRTRFLVEVANLLEVPVIATEQYPTRMGGLDPKVKDLLNPGTSLIRKMSFSCCGVPEFRQAVLASARRKVILVGIETHICVTLTSLDLLAEGFDVFVCPDAVSARSLEMHKLGMERMRDCGVMPSHTETLAYEWMGSAEHPRFREALAVVKNSTS